MIKMSVKWIAIIGIIVGVSDIQPVFALGPNDSDKVSASLMIQYEDRINMLEKSMRELRGQVELLNNTKQQWQKSLDRLADKIDKIDERTKKSDDVDGQLTTIEERLALLEKISQKFYESLNGVTERMVGIEEFMNKSQKTASKNTKDKQTDDKADKARAKLAELMAENSNKANKSPKDDKKDDKTKTQSIKDGENNDGSDKIVLKKTTDALKKLYQSSIDSLNQGEYANAENGFKKIIKEYPDYTITPNSYYWLGEVYFLKNDWNKAAKQFFTTYQKFPNASKAPDSLYRLGLTLHELRKNAESCSALARVAVEFPKSSNFIRQGAADAMNRFECDQ